MPYRIFTCANRLSELTEKKWRFKNCPMTAWEVTDVGSGAPSDDSCRTNYMDFTGKKIGPIVRSYNRQLDFYTYHQAMPAGYFPSFCVRKGSKTSVYFNAIFINQAEEICALTLLNVQNDNGDYELSMNVVRNLTAINPKERQVTYLVPDSLMADSSERTIDKEQLLTEIPKIIGNRKFADSILPIFKEENGAARDRSIELLKKVALGWKPINNPDVQLDHVFQILEKAEASRELNIAQKLRAKAFSRIVLDPTEKSIFCKRAEAIEAALRQLSESRTCDEAVKLWASLFQEEIKHSDPKKRLFFRMMRRILSELQTDKYSLEDVKAFYSNETKQQLNDYIQRKQGIDKTYYTEESRLQETLFSQYRGKYDTSFLESRKDVLLLLGIGLACGGLVVSGLTFHPFIIAAAITSIAASIALFAVKCVKQDQLKHIERQYKTEFVEVCEAKDIEKEKQFELMENDLKGQLLIDFEASVAHSNGASYSM